MEWTIDQSETAICAIACMIDNYIELDSYTYAALRCVARAVHKFRIYFNMAGGQPQLQTVEEWLEERQFPVEIIRIFTGEDILYDL